MNSKKFFIGLVLICALLVVGMFYVTYHGAQLLKAKGDELVELKLQHEVLSDKQEVLTRAKKDIKEYAELDSIAKAIVPQEKDQARTVREIDAIARESGISLGAIQFPESALGAIQKGTKTTTSTDSSHSQLTPVEGMKGLYAMQITVVSDTNRPVSYAQMLAMLKRLEQNRRTAHVTNISITPSEENRNAITFTLTLTVFIKP